MKMIFECNSMQDVDSLYERLGKMLGKTDGKRDPSGPAPIGIPRVPFENMPSFDPSFNARTLGCLKAQDVSTWMTLCSKTPRELLKGPNFGPKCLREVEDVLAKYGRTLTEDYDE